MLDLYPPLLMLLPGLAFATEKTLASALMLSFWSVAFVSDILMSFGLFIARFLKLLVC